MSTVRNDWEDKMQNKIKKVVFLLTDAHDDIFAEITFEIELSWSCVEVLRRVAEERKRFSHTPAFHSCTTLLLTSSESWKTKHKHIG